MYLQITSAYYTHNTNITQGEKEVGLFQEMEKFAKDMVTISKSMSGVCGFFHAAIKMKKEHCFKPGRIIYTIKKIIILFDMYVLNDCKL